MIRKCRLNCLINYQSYLSFIVHRRFHLSRCNYLRRPSSVRKVSNHIFQNDQDYNVAGIFDDSKIKSNSCTNFYGIEGDEGVIFVDELENTETAVDNLEKFNKSLQDNEFKVFSFGAVRLDVENKPTYNGSHSFRRSLKNSTEIPNEEETDQYQNVDGSKTNYQHEYTLSSEKIPKAGTSGITDITSDYANKLSEIMIQKSNGVRNNIKTKVNPQMKIDNFSFEDDKDNYDTSNQEKLGGSENCNDKQYLAKNYSSDSVTLMEGQSRSFIDEHYFAENDFADSDTPKAKHSDNYIDEQYFKEIKQDVSKHEDKSEFLKNNVDKQYINDIKQNAPHNQDKLKSINLLAEHFSPENNAQSIASSEFIITKTKAVKKFVENPEKNQNSNVNFESDINSLNHPYLMNELFLEQKDFTDKETLEITKKHSKMKPKKTTVESSVTSKLNLGSTVESKSKPFTSNLSEQLSAKIASSKMNDFSKSLHPSKKLHDKDIEEKSNVETALDFVKTLRPKQLLSDEVKQGISAKKGKFVDSKGFRILKHQVPTLEYFTRDEILELLQQCVLYSDDDLLVLNKPYNLVIHESNTSKNQACLSRYLDDLAKLLNQNNDSSKLITVHRLDKQTTGCLLLAKNEDTALRLKSLFAQRKIRKAYWIVTTNVPDPQEGIINMPISEGKIGDRSRMVLHPNLPDDVPYVNHSKCGKNAVTEYSVIAVSGNAALVEVRPETGIKHQIRVHFGFGLGCPILGDHKYSHLDKLVPQKLPSDLLQRLNVRQSKVRHIPLHIHAKHILIPHYSQERNLLVSAPLPRHMSENLRFLKFKKK